MGWGLEGGDGLMGGSWGEIFVGRGVRVGLIGGEGWL